ncbi:amidohydrolase [Kordiimonas sp. SCSIO 12610]|uniref:amidohydrolase n=1 Tax=Kordiimonas sp. SCSIO 12610 TaxID=2829597 RepID=UPI002109B682|nr:amidohydrolase [Kordiimonas sp. SCSIO 12610]UTW54414.1 amidohydrolase [Kordiimonas sp. SCSIO 12610]
MNKRKYLIGALVSTALSFSVVSDDLKTAIDKDYGYLSDLYTHLHQNPEISLQEEKTSARIAKELRDIGFEVTDNFGGYGLVGVLKNGDGPTVLVRADMDGLPVLEQTGLDIASRATTIDDNGNTVPVMHACGHDVHMTSFVGAARRLVAMRDSWQGTLVMVGQPAEERVLGAVAMIEEGLFEKFPRPDYNLALHVNASMEAGTVGLVDGYALANVDSVDIAVKGIGGHGAYPHTTKDPVVLASHIVVALQTLVSRETSPLEAAVVTVGSIHSGTKHNIISDGAHLQITVRSYKDDVRKNILDGIKRIARAQALSFGLPEDKMPVVTVGESTPATYNNPELTARIFNTLTDKLGSDRVKKVSPVMGAEDFAHFGRVEPKIPSLMFWLGGVSADDVALANAGKKKLPSLHSPFFAPDREATLKGGVEAMTQAVLELLPRK